MVARTIRSFGLAFTGLALVGGSVAAGCASSDVDTDLGTPRVYGVQSEPAIDLGTAIAQHPLFAPVSNRVDGEIASFVLATSAKDAQGVSAMLASLSECSAAPQLPMCGPLLASLGFTPANMHLDHVQLQQIASDVGLAAVSAEVRDAAFGRAHGLRDGWGSQSAMLTPVLAGAQFSCDALCQETLGNVLGRNKSDYLAKSSDDGPSAGEIAVAVGIAITNATQLEDWIWNSNEEDKECVGDDDCPANQYCHKLGDNDCRPDRAEGALCDRGAQCLSNCCKPWIGTGFLPSCRPADKCN